MPRTQHPKSDEPLMVASYGRSQPHLQRSGRAMPQPRPGRCCTSIIASPTIAFDKLEDVYGDNVDEFNTMRRSVAHLPQALAKEWSEETIDAMAAWRTTCRMDMWDHAFGPDWEKVLDREHHRDSALGGCDAAVPPPGRASRARCRPHGRITQRQGPRAGDRRAPRATSRIVPPSRTPGRASALSVVRRAVTAPPSSGAKRFRIASTQPGQYEPTMLTPASRASPRQSRPDRDHQDVHHEGYPASTAPRLRSRSVAT